MARKVEVCLSPELMPCYDVAGHTVVVVDILRATSCIVAGLGSGIASITPFADLEECRAMQSKGYRIAGERDGQKVAGFDLGNSPYEYMKAENHGKHMATTTTNGTRAIALSAGCEALYIGAFLNISSLVVTLQDSPNDLLIVCAGWKGRFNLEDTLFAGALVAQLKGTYTSTDDAALASLSLYESKREELTEFLKLSAHANRLSGPNAFKDIELCLTWDQFKVVPVLEGHRLIVSG